MSIVALFRVQHGEQLRERACPFVIVVRCAGQGAPFGISFRALNGRLVCHREIGLAAAAEKARLIAIGKFAPHPGRTAIDASLVVV